MYAKKTIGIYRGKKENRFIGQLLFKIQYKLFYISRNNNVSPKDELGYF